MLFFSLRCAAFAFAFAFAFDFAFAFVDAPADFLADFVVAFALATFGLGATAVCRKTPSPKSSAKSATDSDDSDIPCAEGMPTTRMAAHNAKATFHLIISQIPM